MVDVNGNVQSSFSGVLVAGTVISVDPLAQSCKVRPSDCSLCITPFLYLFPNGWIGGGYKPASPLTAPPLDKVHCQGIKELILNTLSHRYISHSHPKGP